MSKKQKGSQKKCRQCSLIVGRPVRMVYFNGDLPNNIGMAWVEKNDVYFVNLKKKTFKMYVKDGKFLMKKFVDNKIKIETSTLYEKYTKAAKELIEETKPKEPEYESVSYLDNDNPYYWSAFT